MVFPIITEITEQKFMSKEEALLSGQRSEVLETPRTIITVLPTREITAVTEIRVRTVTGRDHNNSLTQEIMGDSEIITIRIAIQTVTGIQTAITETAVSEIIRKITLPGAPHKTATRIIRLDLAAVSDNINILNKETDGISCSFFV